MARLPRVVIVDVPHHVTQRGNARQVIFSGDSDRLAYLACSRPAKEVAAKSRSQIRSNKRLPLSHSQNGVSSVRKV
jgi:hypothetical protein